MSKCCFYIHIMASLGASNHVPQKPQQKFIRSSGERDLKIASALKRTLSDSITYSDLSTDRPTDPPMTDTVISDTEIRTNLIPVLQTAKSLIQGQGSQEGEWYQTIRIPALAFLFSLSLAISFLLPYFVTKHALHCRYHFFG